MQIHTQLYNQLQRLFLAQQNAAMPHGIPHFQNQSMTVGNSLQNILSSASKHKTASDPHYAKIGTGFNPNRKSFAKNGLTVSSGLHGHMLNDSQL